jgi:putative DNA primase/helicase
LKKTFSYANNLSGILNWLIEGYRLLRSEGLEPSERIKQALAVYWQDSDIIGTFFAEMVAPSSRGKLLTRDLFNVTARCLKTHRVASFERSTFRFGTPQTLRC